MHRVLSRVSAFCCHGSLRNCGANCVEFFLAHCFCAANTLWNYVHVNLLTISFVLHRVFQVCQSFYWSSRFSLARSSFGFMRLVDSICFLWQRFCIISSRFLGSVLFFHNIESSLCRWLCFVEISMGRNLFCSLRKFLFWVQFCKMGLVFVLDPFGRRSMSAPNTACTRLVGVWRFQAVCVAWSRLRQNGVLSSHPPAGNASR